VIEANTSIAHLQENVFFVPTAGDFNGDGMVDAADYVVWRGAVGTSNVWVDADGNGTVGPEDLSLWRANFGVGVPAAGGALLGEVPEPSAIVMLWIAMPFASAIRRTHRRSGHTM
jgi:hypothetical protein